MKIAGLDVSTFAIDIVLLDLDTNGSVWTKFPLATKKDVLIDRLMDVRNVLGPTDPLFDDVLAIGIERPMKRGHGSTQSAMAFGATLTRLPADRVVKEWGPSEWRKACGLPGNCPKDVVAVWARSMHPFNYLFDQNACDAFCIAFATRAAVESVPATSDSSPPTNEGG